MKGVCMSVTRANEHAQSLWLGSEIDGSAWSVWMDVMPQPGGT